MSLSRVGWWTVVGTPWILGMALGLHSAHVQNQKLAIAGSGWLFNKWSHFKFTHQQDEISPQKPSNNRGPYFNLYLKSLALMSIEIFQKFILVLKDVFKWF